MILYWEQTRSMIIVPLDWTFKKALTINKGGRIVVFNDYTTPNKHCIVDSSKLEKIMRKEVLGFIIQINLVQETKIKESRELPHEEGHCGNMLTYLWSQKGYHPKKSVIIQSHSRPMQNHPTSGRT